MGGLTTVEIARAFLVPEATMAQRISRAKQRIKASRLPFRLPPRPERDERLDAVLQVLYLVFNEGYTSTSGPDLQRAELSAEAIRLARMLRRLLPDDGEVAGLLALMLLTDARRPARTGPRGGRPDGRAGPRAVGPGAGRPRGSGSSPTRCPAPSGPYQLQAAIAAVHAEAARAEDTDWPQILGLYTLLERLTDNPVVTLNRAVAAAMVHGPAAGLALLEPLDGDERLVATTASTRCAPTCGSWPATATRPPRPTGPPPAGPRACPSSATCCPGPRGWTGSSDDSGGHPSPAAMDG